MYRERALDEAPTASHRRQERQHDGASAIPVAVEEVVAEWRRRGMPRQSPTTYRRDAWAETFPEHRELIMSLPLELNRPAVREVIAKLDAGPAWAVRSFVVTQIWGYGDRGYGPSRVRRVLDDAEDRADSALAEALRPLLRLRSSGCPGDAAFETHVDARCCSPPKAGSTSSAGIPSWQGTRRNSFARSRPQPKRCPAASQTRSGFISATPGRAGGSRSWSSRPRPADVSLRHSHGAGSHERDDRGHNLRPRPVRR